jgi:hypothetical protein
MRMRPETPSLYPAHRKDAVPVPALDRYFNDQPELADGISAGCEQANPVGSGRQRRAYVSNQAFRFASRLT